MHGKKNCQLQIFVKVRLHHRNNRHYCLLFLWFTRCDLSAAIRILAREKYC